MKQNGLPNSYLTAGRTFAKILSMSTFAPPQARWTTHISALRSAKFERLIYQLTERVPDVRLTRCHTDKNWVHATTYFEIEGSKAGVTEWKRIFERCVADYNVRMKNI